jgi:transposase
MLAEVVDAVVGGDTHPDTHALEMTAPSGATIATLMIGNHERGFAEAIGWVAEHAPGPRGDGRARGTRSYRIGLARVFQAAGLTVVEIERPRRGERRRGKSDPIDAHLAALHALRLDADRLPMPRADGDREALRILLGARRELTTAKTQTINRLRAIAYARCCSPAATPTGRCPAAR